MITSCDNPNETDVCPLCDSTLIYKIVKQTFEYTSSGVTATLSADVPMQHCPSCGFEGFGEAGERARTEAVYHFLGRLTPWEIVAVRERLGLSQSAFAEWIGVGRASLERWERGAVMHNQSMDNLIMAFSDRGRKAAIDNERQTRLSRSAVAKSVVDLSRFRALREEDTDTLTARQADFRLRSHI